MGYNGNMKTSLNIPDLDLRELVKHSRAKTKTEAVILAIREYNRRRKMKKLSEKLGTFTNLISLSDLKTLRGLD